MNSKFKNGFSLIILYGFLVSIMCGCQSMPAPPDEKQIAEYLPSILTDPYVDDEPLNLSLSNVKIEKRQTNEKDDHVYFHYEMSNHDYVLTGGYYFYYVYYDEGGWILEDVSEYGETELGYTGNTFPAWPLGIDMWVLEQTTSLKYDSVEEIEQKKIDNKTFQFIYNVQKNHLYCKEAGNVTVRYFLKENGWMDYDWVSETDSSKVSLAWDVVGTYTGSLGGSSVRITIDSFNQDTYELYVSYANHVGKHPAITSMYLYNDEVVDVIVQMEESFWNGLPCIEGKLEISYGHSPSMLVFYPNSVNYDSIHLERIP